MLKKIYYQIAKVLYKACGLNNVSTREKWLKKALASIPAGNSILDAGAGELKYKQYCQHLKYTSQDFGQYDGQGDQKGLQMDKWDNSQLDIVSDIIDIPADNESFDAIMCIEVFEHIADPRLAIKEFSRLLKPGGKLIITAPFCSLTHFAPHFYASGYSKYFYKNYLPKYGFQIKEIKYNGNYFEYLAQELYRLSKMSSEYSKTNIFLKILIYLFIFPLLILLSFFSRKNKGSEEVLCFGLQVLAVKQ